MRILLFGKNGQLGWELERTLAPLGHVIALDFPEVDFSHTQDLRQQILQINPQLIVNPAAYTSVDKAEEERKRAELVNGIAPGVLAEAANTLKAALIHFSTDYVLMAQRVAHTPRRIKQIQSNFMEKANCLGSKRY